MSINRMSQVIAAKAFTALAPDADKRTVVTALAEALLHIKRITAEQLPVIIEEAMRREMVGSTGIGHGIAIPHCRTPLIQEIVCSYGHCAQGLDFESLDGEPVHSVFLLLTPPERKEDHLALMKSFASQIRKEHFCGFLHQIQNGQGLVDLLAEFENR
jgi:mannitol/fructose-specific phosphotransferase system IIA component (Ntr-type)